MYMKEGAKCLSSRFQNKRRDDVNMVIVLKAMGAESDQEVMQLAGNDETMSALLVPTIQVGEIETLRRQLGLNPT